MHWMILPLRRYAQFRGRSRRKEYWMFVLFLVIAYALLFGVAVTLGVSAAASGARGAGMFGFMASLGIAAVVIGLFWLAMLLPSIAVAVRRLHDTGRSGWWLMLYIVPYLISTALSIAAATAANSMLQAVSVVISLIGFACALVLLVFMCLEGTRGFNRFGADPKDPAGIASLEDVFG